MDRLRGLVGTVALTACGPTIDRSADPGGQSDADTNATAASTGSTDPDAASSATSSYESSTTTGEQIDEDAFRAMCDAIATQAECDAGDWVTVFADDGHMRYFWCSWETWVPVRLDGDTCVFGPVDARCVAYGPVGPNCGNAAASWRSDESGALELGTTSRWCAGTLASSCVYDREAPAECACLQDPAWPGA